MFGNLYDEPDDNPHILTQSGSLYIDATSWTDWYYIDLKALADSTTRQKAVELTSKPYAIPMSLSGVDDGVTGIYIYWYDVWGQGIKVNEFSSFVPADSQPEPEEWTLAVHRNNVRTNGGAVAETSQTDIDNFSMTTEELSLLTFTEDEWTENAVWADQSQMLNCYIGSQGIRINNVLSSWLTVDLPPIPPAFTHNNHIFVLRLSDGTYAALQLANYLSPSGTKCFLTINYKYPY